jgi:hypothetical protein
VRELTAAGDFGLAPENLGRQRRLKRDAGTGYGDSVFIDHGDRKAARGLPAMREGHKKGERRD